MSTQVSMGHRRKWDKGRHTNNPGVAKLIRLLGGHSLIRLKVP